MELTAEGRAWLLNDQVKDEIGDFLEDLVDREVIRGIEAIMSSPDSEDQNTGLSLGEKDGHIAEPLQLVFFVDLPGDLHFRRVIDLEYAILEGASYYDLDGKSFIAERLEEVAKRLRSEETTP